MEESCSYNNGPSMPVPSLQNTGLEIYIHVKSTEEYDFYDPTTETSPLLWPRGTFASGTPPPAPAELRAVAGSGRRCNWKKLLTTICLWLAYLVVSAAYSIIGPFFPSEAEAKGSSSVITGVIVSSSSLCVFILSPLTGYLLPHLGLKFTLIAGLVLVGGAFVLLGFVEQMPSGWVFILFCVLLRMTKGAGSAMFFTAAYTLILELYPSKVNSVMGMFEVAAGLGFAMGPVIGGALYQLGGFKVPFLSVGGIVLLSVIPCLILVRSADCSAKTLSLKMIWKLMTNFEFFVLAIANVLTLAAICFFNPTLEPFLKQQFNLSPFHVGLVFLAFPAVYMSSSLIVGLLSDKLGQRKFIISGFMVFGLSYFFIGPADFIARPQVWITCVALGVSGVGTAMGSIPIYADMVDVSKAIVVADSEEVSRSLLGVVSGIVSSTLSFGQFLGPVVSGALTEIFDFQTSSLLFGELLLAEGFLVLGVTLINKFCHRT